MKTPYLNSKPHPKDGGAQQITPEFFSLPAIGGDLHFGLSRSTYYDFERRGLLRLVRLRKPGNIRGKVLVPYNAVQELIMRFDCEPSPHPKPAMEDTLQAAAAPSLAS